MCFSSGRVSVDRPSTVIDLIGQCDNKAGQSITCLSIKMSEGLMCSVRPVTSDDDVDGTEKCYYKTQPLSRPAVFRFSDSCVCVRYQSKCFLLKKDGGRTGQHPPLCWKDRGGESSEREEG